MEEAHDRLLAAMLGNWWEWGGVVYKNDEFLLSLGYEGPDAYLRDENGHPVIRDRFATRTLKMLRFYLGVGAP